METKKPSNSILRAKLPFSNACDNTACAAFNGAFWDRRLGELPSGDMLQSFHLGDFTRRKLNSVYIVRRSLSPCYEIPSSTSAS